MEAFLPIHRPLSSSLAIRGRAVQPDMVAYNHRTTASQTDNQSNSRPECRNRPTSRPSGMEVCSALRGPSEPGRVA